MNKPVLVLSDTEKELEQCHDLLGERWQLTSALDSSDALSKLGTEPFSMLLVSESLESDELISFEAAAERTRPATPLVRFENAAEPKKMAFRSLQDQWQLLPDETRPEPIADQLARRLLKQRLVTDQGLKKLVPKIKTLPSWRSVYHKVVKEINSPDGSLGRVADLVEDDPILTARILKTANSAAFGFRRRISDPQQAVMLLGGERLKSILIFTVVLSVTEYNQCQGFNPERFWSQSVRSAELARTIMRTMTSDQNLVDAAFTAGLVHDIGHLLMAVNIPEDYTQILVAANGDETRIQDEEYQQLETSHTELGTQILESWDLPYPILEAVLWHHSPERIASEDNNPLAAVFLSDAILGERRRNPKHIPEHESSDFIRAKEIFGSQAVENWVLASKTDA